MAMSLFNRGSDPFRTVETAAAVLLPAAVFLAGTSILRGANFPLRSDFERYRALSGASGHVRGELPPEWGDDSGWADVDVIYGPARGKGVNGGTALEIRVTRVRSGRVQLVSRAVHPAPGKVLIVTAWVRSPDALPVEMLFRKVAPPYTTWWRRRITALPEWRQVRFEIPVRFDDPEPYFMVAVDRPGTLLLDNVSVEMRDLTAWLALRISSGPNLLPNGRFPLGLTNAWTLSHVGRGLNTAGADPERTGPSGSFPLKVTVRREKALLQSPPFAVEPEKTYTVSFAVSSDDPHTPVSVRVLPEGAWEEFVAERRWQRFSFRFRPSLKTGGIVSLEFTFNGTVWLDGVQVERGQVAAPFHRKNVELHLAPRDFMGLTMVDDPDATPDELPPVEILVTACGAVPPDAVVRLSETDLSGNRRVFRPIPASKVAARVIRVPIPADLTRPMGSWRITGEILTSAGAKRVGNVSEVVVHRVFRPRRFRKLTPEFFFGIHVSPAPRQCRMAALLGFKWVRVHDAAPWITKWVDVEPAPGSWVWSDDDVARYRDWGLSVLGMLGTSPPWASVRPVQGGAGGYWRGYYLPKNPADWERYVETVVRHYRGAIRAWEVWNEPWSASFFRAGEKDGKPVHGSPEQYMELLRKAYRAAHRAAGRRITVLGPCTAPAGCSRQCLKRGLLNAIDGFSYHQYTSDLLGFPGDAKERELAAAVRIQKRFGDPKPVWNTEGGLGPALLHFYDGALIPVSPTESAEDAAVKAVRYCLAELAAGTRHLFLYTMHGWKGFNAPSYSLLSADGTVHPLAAAVSHLAFRVDGLRFIDRREVRPGVFACAFRRHRRTVIVVYTAKGDRRRLLVVPGGTAYDMMGNRRSAPLAIGLRPVYITKARSLESALAVLSQAEVWESPDTPAH